MCMDWNHWCAREWGGRGWGGKTPDETEIKDWREKPVEWATRLLYLARLGLLLLFTADTNKPHNEMRARKRIVGLPAHQPWCHKLRLDWTIWHNACCPSNPQPPSRHVCPNPNSFILRAVYLSLYLFFQPITNRQITRHTATVNRVPWIYCFVC